MRIPHPSKTCLAAALLGTKLSLEFGDHHQEASWYNYGEEIDEPRCPKENLIGLVVN